MNSNYQTEFRLSLPGPNNQAVAAQQPIPPLNLAAKVVMGLMQVKDTVQIGLMLYSSAIIFGIMGGVGIPGLVLYGLRWRQLRRGSRRRNSLILAVLGIIHEVFWAMNFPLDGPPPMPDEEYPIDIRLHGDSLRSFYWVGAALMLLVLLACLWSPAEPQTNEAEATEGERNK